MAKDDVHEEYAQLYSGGNMFVLNDNPEVERVAPMAGRICHILRQGGEVYMRRVIVVEEWEQVQFTGQRCDSPVCRTCARPPRRHE